MEYDFLVDTYATEILKTLSGWSTFEEADLVRPHPLDARDRNTHEHVVHQCLSDVCRFCPKTC